MFKGLRKVEEALLVSSMALILILIFSQALFRYLFGSGFVWGEELARFVHVAQVWLGASLVIRTGGHIRVTFLRDLFSRNIKKYIDLLSTSIFFLFTLFIAVKGTEFIIQLVSTGQKAPSMGILMAIPYIVIPLGGLLMSLRLIQQFRSILKGELIAEEALEGVDK